VDVSEYFMQKEKEFSKYGTIPDDPDNLFHVEDGSAGNRGFLRGYLSMGPNAFLRVYERVVAHRRNVHRDAYCYTLIIHGVHVYRWERDPRTHPEDPVHEHEGAEEARRPKTKPIALKKVL
jgi:hypothetical protein